MSTNRAQLCELRERLGACASEVTPRAESFHRELVRLSSEVEGALSWHGGFGLGQSAGRLHLQVEALCDCGRALQELFARTDQLEQQRSEAVRALERITALALHDPDAIPTRLERLRSTFLRVGRQVKTARCHRR